MKTWTVTSVDELGAVAREILNMKESGARVLALTGDLGAGKTAFTQCIARELGVALPVVSPTFVIMKRYGTTDTRWSGLVHIDAYRIEEEEEAVVLHIPDLLASENTLTCIEWPEHVKNLIPESAERVSLVLNEDGTRTITYHA